MSTQRTYDIVLLGATGYTGRLTAEHIQRHLPTNLKWAIAGRSRDKLERLAEKLKGIDSNRLQPAIEVAQLNREDLGNLLEKSTVCISSVGPFSQHGEVVVEACIAQQTHYVDTNGDVAFDKEMYDKYEDSAKKSGTLLVSACGNFTAPQDLLTLAVVSELNKKTSLKTKEVILSVCEMNIQPSGGSLLSIFELFENQDPKAQEEIANPWCISPIQGSKASTQTNIFGMRQDPDLGSLSANTLGPENNRPIVHRSWALLDGGKRYGPNFQYNEYVKVSGVIASILGYLSMTLLFAMLSLGPVRSLAKYLLFSPGQGPDPDETKKSRIELQAVAVADQSMGNPARAFGTLSFAGGPYHITAVYLAHGAASLLYNKDLVKSLGGGFITPAILGHDLIDRAEKDGVKMETKMV